MNQIICTSNCNIEYPKDRLISVKRKYYFKLQFILFFITFILLIIYCILYRFNLSNNEKKSEELTHNFGITTIYETSNNYNTTRINQEINLNDTNSFLVIGMIEIDKLGISYPIISNINHDFLKLAPCRLCGPMPNEIGNLCIAGHNYKNDTFFSNISNLDYGDIIKIYDNKGKLQLYKTENVYKTKQTDLSCTNQDNNNLKVITLITCDSSNDNFRTIVKAVETT